MDVSALRTLDSWPYRHRLADVMRAPVATVTADTTLAEAARRMVEAGIGALPVVDDGGCITGILSERDALRLAAEGGAPTAHTVGSLMSAPVDAMPADTFVYRALARMQRRGFRHMPVVDAAGHPVGMVSARTLLAQRAAFALALGDEIDVAADAAALRATHDRLPALATALLADDVSPPAVAAVIAAVTRDMTGRAAALAQAAMIEDGRGPAPCGWCLLVLGSAGRGESLLAPDQDNALILDPRPEQDASAVDDWFAAFAGRLNAILDSGGIPLCKGGVMAREADYRRTRAGWRTTVARWAENPDGEAVLAADIFFDLVSVAGDATLADGLRKDAIAAVASSPLFLRRLAEPVGGAEAALGWFGTIRLKEGRVDVKRAVLMPIVATLRVLALRRGIEQVATKERLRELRAQGVVSEADATALERARETAMAVLLRQQIADITAGKAPGNAVDPGILDRPARRALRWSIERATLMPGLVGDAL